MCVLSGGSAALLGVAGKASVETTTQASVEKYTGDSRNELTSSIVH